MLQILNGSIDPLCTLKWDNIYMALRVSKLVSAMLDWAEQAGRVMLALPHLLNIKKKYFCSENNYKYTIKTD